MITLAQNTNACQNLGTDVHRIIQIADSAYFLPSWSTPDPWSNLTNQSKSKPQGTEKMSWLGLARGALSKPLVILNISCYLLTKVIFWVNWWLWNSKLDLHFSGHIMLILEIFFSDINNPSETYWVYCFEDFFFFFFFHRKLIT